MKRILPFFLLSFFIAACTTMPAEIEEKYLVQKSETESKAISGLEMKIISKNREKQEAEKKITGQEKLPAGIEEEIKLLKKENGTLKDQVFFYEKNKDAVNLEQKKAQLAENETTLAKKTATLEYSQSEKKLLEADLELKNAELAQLIAELDVEKSKIAAVYRDKTEPAKPAEKQNFIESIFNKKDPNDKYGYKKYDEYLDKKKEETLKADTGYKEALKNFQKAKATLEKLK